MSGPLDTAESRRSHGFSARARQAALALWVTAACLVVLNLIGGALSSSIFGQIEVRIAIPTITEGQEEQFDRFIDWLEQEAAFGPIEVISDRTKELPKCGPESIVLSYHSTVYRLLTNPVLKELNSAGLVECQFEYVRTQTSESFDGFLALAYVPAALVMLAFWAFLSTRPRLRNLFVHWTPAYPLSDAVSIGALTGVLAILATIACNIIGTWMGVLDEQVVTVTGVAYSWALLPLMVLVAPIVEEYLFRAWLQGRLGYAVGDTGALLVATPIFIVAHFPSSMYQVALLAIPGILFGTLWMKSRSLTACVVSHATFNLFVVGMLWTGAARPA